MFKDKRIKYVVIVVFLGAAIYSLMGSKKDYPAEIAERRATYKSSLLNATPSPIANIKDFSDFNYFVVDKKWRITAEFLEEPGTTSFPISMTDSSTEELEKAGWATFSFEGKSFKLLLFNEGENFLLPFYDLTNGKETYGGGRFINVENSGNNRLVIDFNNAHNFYCAYTPSFVCPIPPPENKIDLAIEAGEKVLFK